MLKRKFYEETEIEIISVQQESIVTLSITDYGNDGDEDKATGWNDITKGQ